MPASLNPLVLIMIVVPSVIVGAPIGYLISLRGGGVLTGAAISGFAFAILRILISLPVLMRSGDLLMTLMSVGAGGIVAGLLPGAIIGWHVAHSD